MSFGHTHARTIDQESGYLALKIFIRGDRFLPIKLKTRSILLNAVGKKTTFTWTFANKTVWVYTHTYILCHKKLENLYSIKILL